MKQERAPRGFFGKRLYQLQHAPRPVFRAVLASAADRWARRISRSGAIDDKEIGLIAEALAVPVSVAEKWAQEQDGRILSEPDLRQSLIQLGMNS